MDPLIDRDWHSLPAGEAVGLFGGDPAKGFDLPEVERRLAQYGPNSIAARKGKGPLQRFLLQFHQPLIHILIASGVVTAALREWVDAGVIFGVVLVNATIGYLQEAKAVNALAALARTIVSEATVLRQGKKKRISSAGLVPGDIVFLQSGDKVPADMRLLQVRDLQIDESALTGESVPVVKTAEPLARDTMLADRKNMAYASTLVTYGQATGVVTATGEHTEMGRISRLMTSSRELATPLTRKIDRFSRIMLYAILALAAVTVGVGLIRGEPPFDMFMAAVALAVGAIPEGLPAAMTITLAIGVARMARRNAIIRKLPAVETLGSTSIICSDKTGTLTENQMTVKEIMAGGAWYEVSGAGYDPHAGEIRTGGGIPLPLAECLRAAALCNDSVLVERDGRWRVEGDPTEGGLLTAALKGGYDPALLEKELPRLDAVPFESLHQYMATLHETGAGKPQRVYLKGAVEAVVARCASMLGENGDVVELDADAVFGHVERMAGQGLRVLAFATKELPDGTRTIRHENVASGLVFIGLMGMMDPPRSEAVVAVRACQAAGIRIKMITGDHALTAAAIAGQIGLDGGGRRDAGSVAVLTGRDLAALSGAELSEAAERTAVFARVTPEQKLRLVEALQGRGHVVAMTGDGVNDAPALKRADIGIAMGVTGTEVSREAADMVLTDDNFSSIEAAVEEGRGVFDNLTKFIVWTLPTNLGEGLVIMTAVLLGVTLPILPVQILWINMTTAGFLGLMLAFEPKEPGIMERPPRPPGAPILTGKLILRIMLVGGMLTVAAFSLFHWETARGADPARARTVAVNVFVVMELFYLFNCRSLAKPVFGLGFFTNKWLFAGAAAMMLAQIAYTYAPAMNRLFHSAPVPAAAWLRIIAAGAAAFIAVEIERVLFHRAAPARRLSAR